MRVCGPLVERMRRGRDRILGSASHEGGRLARAAPSPNEEGRKGTAEVRLVGTSSHRCNHGAQDRREGGRGRGCVIALAAGRQCSDSEMGGVCARAVGGRGRPRRARAVDGRLWLPFVAPRLRAVARALAAGGKAADDATALSTLPKYSWRDVAKHNTAESAWMIVKGKVYDITRMSALRRRPHARACAAGPRCGPRVVGSVMDGVLIAAPRGLGRAGAQDTRRGGRKAPIRSFLPLERARRFVGRRGAAGLRRTTCRDLQCLFAVVFALAGCARAAWLDRHPGGREVLLLGAGRECTELFASYHPFTAKPEAVLASYLVRGPPPRALPGGPSRPFGGLAAISDRANSALRSHRSLVPRPSSPRVFSRAPQCV